MPASTGRREFYSGAERLSKRLAQLSWFDALFAGLIHDGIHLILYLFLFVFHLLDLVRHGRHCIAIVGVDAP